MYKHLKINIMEVIKQRVLYNTYSLPSRCSFLSKEIYFTYIEPRIMSALTLDGDIPTLKTVNASEMLLILKGIFPLHDVSVILTSQIGTLKTYRFFIKTYTNKKKYLLDFSAIYNI